MNEATVVPPAGGEVVGDSPARRVEIVAEHDALHATVSRFGPHRDGADLHVHRRNTDVFYVLEGELTVRLGPEGREVPAPAGSLARVPPLVVHGFRNAGDAQLRYLNFHAPGVGFADYLRGLRDGRTVVYDQEPPPDDGGRPPSEATVGGHEFATERDRDHVVLLADVESIAVAEVSSEAPGGPPPHLHARHVESFYVLDGELALTFAGRVLRAPAGTWVQIPAGVPHAVAPAASERARYLDVHTPSCGFGAYLRALAGGVETDVARAGFDERPAP
jgi:mannose-6-phosphate isomerase-like protein (cupin superfamily)